MILRKPNYYDEFVCAASACPDSCCKEWAVDIDDDTAKMYLSLPGKLGDDLRSCLKCEDGGYYLEITAEGRCPMWRQDGLCRIQCELGESALSHVCDTFPRLTHDYGTFREKQLELSCPVAAELIFKGDAAWAASEDGEAGEMPDYDESEMEILLSSRQELTEILLDPSKDVRQALMQAILYAYHAEDMLDAGEMSDFSCPEIGEIPVADPEKILDFYKNLEILNPAWLDRLEHPQSEKWEDSLRNLAVYFVQRYFLQAISDRDIATRVRFAVLSCVVVHLLGGDAVTTAQQYSKEIENDPDNLEAIFDGLCFDDCLSDGQIFGCLMA